MKRYSISVVLHILLLVVLSIGGYLLFCYELWFNPLAARKPGDPYQDGEVPDTDYNVVVFENKFSQVSCLLENSSASKC